MNDALTLPFFQSTSSSYSHTPPFPDNYDGTFTNNGDDFYGGSYDLDTETDGIVAGQSISDDRQRSNGRYFGLHTVSRSCPGLGYSFPTPPASSHSANGTYAPTSTFNPSSSSSSSYMPNFYTNPAFLDVNVNVARQNFDQPGPSTYSRQSSTGEEYIQQHSPEDESLTKLEDGVGHDGENGNVDEEEEGEVDNEEPLYVNAKQYHRILKRRAARQRLEELNRLARSRKVS